MSHQSSSKDDNEGGKAFLPSLARAKEMLFRQTFHYFPNLTSPTTTTTSTTTSRIDDPGATETLPESSSTASSIQEFEKRLHAILPERLSTESTEHAPQHQSDHSELEEKSNFTRLDHCSQLEVWDCGVACLLIVLRWLRSINGPIREEELSTNLTPEEMYERDAILKRIGATSIWTAELVWELHTFLLQNNKNQNSDSSENDNHHDNSYLFCSKTLQVEAEYQDVGYYQSQFSCDQQRVNTVFHKLLQNQASMICLERVPLEYVIDAVAHSNCVAIVLVDNSVLTSTGNTDGKHPFTPKHLKDDDKEDRYQGHYVILCGTSQRKEHLESAQSYQNASHNQGSKDDFCLVLCNPNRYTPWMYVTPRRFESSWRSRGTDDDIIFVVRDSKKE